MYTAAVPPSPQGLSFESKHICVFARGQPGEAAGEGRKSQDEEKCTKQALAPLIQRKLMFGSDPRGQFLLGFDTFPHLKGIKDIARFRHEAFPHLRHGNVPFAPKKRKGK